MTHHRLGIYCPGAGTGGPWRYVHSILAGISPDEFKVTVFCGLAGVYEPRPWINLVQLNDEKLVAATSVPRAATDFTKRLLFRPFVPQCLRLWSGFLKEARQLSRLLRQHPVEIFHTQNTGCEESPIAAKMTGIPYVLGTFHVDSSYDLARSRSGPSYRVLEHLSNHCLDVGIAVSRQTGRDWVRRTHIPARRVITIYNGIDTNRFKRQVSRSEARRQFGLPEDALIVGGLGRLDEAKGFDYLLNAAAILRSEFPTIYVTIAGIGPLRDRLEALATRLGIMDRVKLLGFQADVQLPLDALDVFALPSRCEALPYALLEAMATELPAVGASVGGVPEIIVPGETGFLVPPRNPEALAAALRPLLESASLREKMGRAGRERVVRHFQEKDMVRRTIQLYRDLLRGRYR